MFIKEMRLLFQSRTISLNFGRESYFLDFLMEDFFFFFGRTLAGALELKPSILVPG